MTTISETLVYYEENPDFALCMHETSEAELAPFWPLDEQITRYLTESERTQTLATPAAALKGPEPIPGERSLTTGFYALEDGEEQLIGIGYLHLPERDYPGIGQYILKPSKLGVGYGSLAIHGMTRQILDVMRKPLAQAATLDANKPSQTSLLRAGFVQMDLPDPPQTRPCGPHNQQSTVFQYLLAGPNQGYKLPEGKFQDPPEAHLAISRQKYYERNQVIHIER